jgi:uncharacterized peroxidase-related enzyme
MSGSFLEEPAVSAHAQELFDEDLADDGFVWNVTRLWAHQPDTLKQLFALMSEAFRASGLSFRQRGILVTAAASTLGDSYCSLAWGGKLATATEAALAAGVLTGADAGLTDQEKALADWARKVARDPNATTPADIAALRDCGLDDGQIFAVTTFVALRLAFSTINDSLGAQPDGQLAQSLPAEVRAAVTYGRPVADGHTVLPPARETGTPRAAPASGPVEMDSWHRRPRFRCSDSGVFSSTPGCAPSSPEPTHPTWW